MLQQTQVGTVLGYFDRSVATLPDVGALAAVAEDGILHLWTKLGYYSRTRSLHRTVQIAVERHARKFPRDVEQLAELFGTGRSTTRAIASLSMGLCTPILDGNIKRILACYLAQDGYSGEPEVTRALWEAVERFAPHAWVNHYTQAVMGLGATLRTRGKPSCLLCPLVSGCRARLLNRKADYPQPKPRKALSQKRTPMPILANCDGAVLLYRRSSSGLRGGPWNLPELDDLDGLEPLAAHHPLVLGERRELSGLTRTFSHFQLVIEL